MELSLKDIRELIGGTSGQTGGSHPFAIGQKVFIRTVTYHLTGRVKAIYDQGMVLDTAAWIADSGRFADAMKSCEFSEVEPFTTDVYISLAAITDATWIDTLPTKQK